MNKYLWRPILYTFQPQLIGCIVKCTKTNQFSIARIDFHIFKSNRFYFESEFKNNFLKNSSQFREPWINSDFWNSHKTKFGPFYTERIFPDLVLADNDKKAIRRALRKYHDIFQLDEKINNITKLYRGKY